MLQHSIPDAFLRHAILAPHAPALLGDGEVTYGQLASRASGIAAWLLTRGIGRGSTVGLFAQRSADSIAAILGILKTGAAYVPLDPSYPPKLLKYMYDDSAPAVTLVQDSLLTGRPEDVFWSGEAVPLGDLRNAVAPPQSAPEPAVRGDDPAYVMYTSGSTGRPKGVVVPHQAVLRLVLENDFASVGSDEVILHLAPLSFDACTFEIWAALLNGGRLAIVSDPHPSLEDIAAAIERHGVTTMWLTAGLFHLMVDHQLDGLRPLRQLLAGGDVLSPTHVVKVLRELPGCRLINGYGPTENTTFTCCYSVPPEYRGEGPLPIGRPIRNTQVYVVDESLRPVAPGEDGELLAGGLGLAHGYLNQQELTRERFVPSPFDPTPGARLYRTGDRVRQRPDGVLEFLGRADRQVKINGKRVELDEIETRLRASGRVQDAAVVCSAATAERRYIAAYVTPLGTGPVDMSALRRFLRDELPDYMVPASLTELPSLPLSPTGKIDRGRLPAVVPTPGNAATSAHAASATATALLEIWRSVLGRDAIGVDDNFFDLGGTSLQLVDVHARVQRSLAREVTVVELFEYPRISALAAYLAERSAGATPAPSPSATLSAADRAQRQRAALARRRPTA